MQYYVGGVNKQAFVNLLHVLDTSFLQLSPGLLTWAFITAFSDFVQVFQLFCSSFYMANICHV